jgi:GTP cyclohydrolase I
MDPTKIERGFRQVLEGLGLDPNHPNLKETPRRTAEAWVTELCAGLTEPEPGMDLIPLEEGHRAGLIALDQIPVKSLCAHHLLPFVGQAVVAYIPRDAICGLSKLSRVVNHFARRPQLQEQLTQQVAEYLQKSLNPLGVGVLIRASHSCMEFRGVNHPGTMTTSMLLGALETHPQFRAEFLALAHPAAGKSSSG